jgi:hypothetical protein
MFARESNSATDYQSDPDTGLPINIGEWIKRQEEIISLVLPAVAARAKKNQSKYRERLDKTRKILTTSPLNRGTVVMIKDPAYLLEPGKKPSTAPTYIGPYVVQRMTKYGTYVLNDETGDQLDRSVPLDQIKVITVPGLDSIRPSTSSSTSPSLDNFVYVVERILDDREDEKGNKEYFVKWKDYPASQNTWEPISHFTDIAIIDAYERAKIRSAPSQRRKPRLRTLQSGIVQLDLTRSSLLDSSKQSN